MQEDKELEKEARKLRDALYGKKISDQGWLACKDNWVKEILWLRMHVRRFGIKI